MIRPINLVPVKARLFRSIGDEGRLTVLEVDAGVAHLGVVMIGDSMDELMADMELFAAQVLPGVFVQPGKISSDKWTRRRPARL